jgi:hypothetical protein
LDGGAAMTNYELEPVIKQKMKDGVIPGVGLIR